LNDAAEGFVDGDDACEYARLSLGDRVFRLQLRSLRIEQRRGLVRLD